MTKRLLKAAGVVIWVSVAAGCASAPTQEMSDARQAVQAARDAGAPLHTPAAMDSAEQDLTQAEQQLRQRDYKSARQDAVAAKQEAVRARNMALVLAQAKQAVQEAEEQGALTQVTRDWLAKAEAASAAGDEEEVARTAKQARLEAEDDIRRMREEKLRAERENQEWLDKVPALLEEGRRAEARLTSEQREALKNAEAAYQQHDGRNAYDMARTVAEQVRALPPLPRTLQYQVTAGDSLWSIAARRDVYGNPLWWPLIYRRNSGRIPDADLLTPGQALTIELNPAADAVNKAVQFAARREGAPDKLKQLDAEYLSGAK
jgi:nucleoid-associated protein YgaU